MADAVGPVAKGSQLFNLHYQKRDVSCRRLCRTDDPNRVGAWLAPGEPSTGSSGRLSMALGTPTRSARQPAQHEAAPYLVSVTTKSPYCHVLSAGLVTSPVALRNSPLPPMTG